MKIIDLLKEAKALYLKEIEYKDYCDFPGMCWCFKVIANKNKSRIEQGQKGHVPYNVIVAQIPEFNPKFFDAPISSMRNLNILIGLEFWWHVSEVRERVKAFDKLIELYKDSDKEFIW